MQVQPFLMFTGEAEAAMRFYLEVFPLSEILEVKHYGPDQAGPEGTVFLARFRIAGQTMMCIDSPIRHDFTFTPALSMFVDCDSEVDHARIAAALAEGGTVLMPLGDYGFSRSFAWVNDRFGVSWQVNLP